MRKILVTGATGKVGSAVAVSLIARGADIIATSKDVNKLERFRKIGIECRRLDITDSFTWGEAFKGVDKVFLIRPPAVFSVRREMEPFLEYLSELNLTQAAFLSVLGAERSTRLPHYRIELSIIRNWIPYTFLRPSLFMQNLTDLHLEEIKTNGELFIPSRTGYENYVDIGDVAEAAATVLTEEGHLSKTYELMGGETIDYSNVADILTSILGRKIAYKNPTIPEFLWSKRNHPNPLSFVIVLLSFFSSMQIKKFDISNGSLERLIGRKPTTLNDFILANKNTWE